MSQPDLMRQEFNAQRTRGVNVDWFTWQIAWNAAVFTTVSIDHESPAQIVIRASDSRTASAPATDDG
ncbi:hypothetical protein [Paraburkholderia sp. SIMBA_027]|uniref:hypothetical protein n=1 Tax=Paraburkholderia sp. SIMBA_027 TaxID=3085770 RepID=UPI00397D0BF4